MAYPKAQRNIDTQNQMAGARGVHASLSDYRQSPRKVRLVARLVSGKTVRDAIVSLSFLDKRAALPIKKLIESAYANAKSMNGVDAESLVISKIVVDKGVVLKRMMPRARGSAARIKKRSSHVTLTLAPQVLKTEKVEKVVKAVKATKEPKAKKTKA